MSASFPKGFLWGTATAAHQVEGGNVASDFWLMETMKPSLFVEPSGDACDHYHLYPSDIALIAQLGFNAYRFSIEWARIEPEEGFVSRAALDHYRRMIACCLANGVTPMVTFHHFTAPLWFTRDGGWEDARSVDRFARYCEKAGRALGDLIAFACTINEANIPIMATMMREAVGLGGRGDRREAALAEAARRSGGAAGRFAPYLSGDGRAATPNLIAAHRKSYESLKPLVKGPVGITLSLNDFQAEPGGEALRDAADRAINLQFLESARGDDFIGVQTYTRVRFAKDALLPPDNSAETTQMGYEFFPEALEACIRKAARVCGCPVIVTENGIGTEDDARRIEYTRRALEGVRSCLADGIDVRGYMHWSMMDNFEWLEGYRPKFGLIGVDRKSQLRIPKPSAYWLGGVARNNALPD
ncbi:MAG TPA: family 1 glycosylhydrolase [Rhizomicrobium sp.]|jgi:beta-glucosidase|nr:family 1 glycosylhydrolase [Rhizomicrobium sp.]